VPENKPHKSDLILGGKNPPPLDGAVLGGLVGIERRLASESTSERLQALNDSVRHGEKAIYLSLRALKDEDRSVQNLASKLLRDRFGMAGEEALSKNVPCMESHYDPFDRKCRIYDPNTGITEPEDITYIIKIKDSDEFSDNKNNVDRLLNDSNIHTLRSLIVELDFILLYQWIRDEHLLAKLMNPIFMESATPNLKSLGINYQCDEYEYPKIDDRVKQQAMSGLEELILNSQIAQQNLKYFKIIMPTFQSSQYITMETIDKLKRSGSYKSPPFTFITNMRVNFG
jgi:hypothetical protein